MSGVLETRALKRVQVFACPQAANYDAGQACPTDSKTNIQQIAESYEGLSEWLGMISITLSAKASIFS